jgi:hypothetical protein
VYTRPFCHPVIEQVAAEAGVAEPILADSTLLVTGRGLRGEVTQVRVAGQDVTPVQVQDTQIRLQLSSLPAGALKAGVQGLQVVQRVMMGEPPAPHGGVESNVAAFVLRPKVRQDPVTKAYLIAKAAVAGGGDGPYALQVKLQVTPAIGRTQRVVLLLNQVESSTDQPAAYAFPAPARDAEGVPESDESITIPIQGVKKATYLLRLQVDGAESPLDFEAGRYSGPVVTIP